jgi:PAS domain S-box-containing protein
MLMVGGDGVIVLVNKQLEGQFGYRGNELVGQKVEMLMPERFRTMHPGLRHGFFAQPEARTLGHGRELLALRKDGSEFPVEIGLSPMRTEQGLFVLASVVDVTERRQVEQELRENHEELQRLAAQILGAQETERRRIARELHDDFGQDLALVSVELDLLRQRLQASPAEAAPRIQAISDRVKQLSSSIHDLSHQLHPMKLEQLGLVAALGGLCKELGQNHDLSIEFTHEQVPETIPHEAALCLYRIAQEALRNVVKHSGAASAMALLAGRSGSLVLEVRDDGRGFDSTGVAGQGGLGLVSMRERLRLLDGELAIDTGPDAGTRLVARVPLATAPSASVESTPGLTGR